LAASITNENKFKKDMSILLIVSAIFFDQYQFTVIQMDLDHSNISDEDSVKIIKLLIEFFNKYHE
jgi:hypothetical protein